MKCRDCEHFKEALIKGGEGWRWRDNTTRWKDDSCKFDCTVNHPNHYTSGKIECIDAIESAVCELKGIEAVCTANAIKYLWRWKQKNGAEDLKKATWYIERLLKGGRRRRTKNLKNALLYIERLLKEVEKDAEG